LRKHPIFELGWHDLRNVHAGEKAELVRWIERFGSRKGVGDNFAVDLNKPIVASTTT
jgi:hypothetical protein